MYANRFFYASGVCIIFMLHKVFSETCVYAYTPRCNGTAFFSFDYRTPKNKRKTRRFSSALALLTVRLCYFFAYVCIYFFFSFKVIKEFISWERTLPRLCGGMVFNVCRFTYKTLFSSRRMRTEASRLPPFEWKNKIIYIFFCFSLISFSVYNFRNLFSIVISCCAGRSYVFRPRREHRNKHSKSLIENFVLYSYVSFPFLSLFAFSV